jgi:hypothetical protein
MRVVCLQTGPLDYCVEFAAAAARRVELPLIGAAAELEPIRDQLPAELALAPLPWPRHRSLANLRLLRDVLARIRDHRPAVVHFLGDSTLWLNLALPFLRHLPRVVTIHDVHLHPGDVQSRRVPRRAQRRVMPFFWPTRASSANQISIASRPRPWSRAMPASVAGKFF